LGGHVDGGADLADGDLPAECQDRSTRGSQFFPRVSGFSTRERAPSPSVFFSTWGRIFFILSPNGAVCLGRYGTLFFSESGSSPSVALGEDEFFRVLFFPECQVGYGSRGNLSSPRATLRKDWLPRVLDFWHSGKPLTLGKFPFSRSE
jgi:hypothetical protein